jgi:hypothetical protein
MGVRYRVEGVSVLVVGGAVGVYESIPGGLWWWMRAVRRLGVRMG